MRREMFRQKQNQAVQLIGIHPLGAQLDDNHDRCRSQQSDDTSVTTARGKQQGGSKIHDTKMNPARRSQSLEGNLDNIGVDHVTILEGNKRKSFHSSHPHGLDGDILGNQQMSKGVTSLPVKGRRLQIIATPPSSSPSCSLLSPRPPPPDVSNSPTVTGAGSREKATSSESEGTCRGQPASQFPAAKTNYPDPKTDSTSDDVAFRVRTDTANSAMFDISYDL